MVILKKRHLDAIYEHAKDVYPYECCGALVGRMEGKEVKEVYRLKNISRQRNRYETDPKELFKIYDEAWKNQLDVIGFYHSHPDYPPQPSSTDSEDKRVVPYISYLIVSIDKNHHMSVKSWVFDIKCKRFNEENITITD